MKKTIGLILTILLSSCELFIKQEEPKTTIIEGQVIDQTTNVPIDSVLMIIGEGNIFQSFSPSNYSARLIDNDYTDEFGNFYVSYTKSFFDSYHILGLHKKFKEVGLDTSLKVLSGETNVINYFMKPYTSYCKLIVNDSFDFDSIKVTLYVEYILEYSFTEQYIFRSLNDIYITAIRPETNVDIEILKYDNENTKEPYYKTIRTVENDTIIFEIVK